MTSNANKKQKKANQPIKKVISKEEVIVKTETVMEEKAIFLKNENPTARYLKVTPFYRQYERQAANSFTSTVVPELKLRGQWMEEAGFTAGDYVSVTVMDGLLVIRAAKVEAGSY